MLSQGLENQMFFKTFDGFMEERSLLRKLRFGILARVKRFGTPRADEVNMSDGQIPVKGILKLASIAGPIIVVQGFQHSSRQMRGSFVLEVLPQEMVNQAGVRALVRSPSPGVSVW